MLDLNKEMTISVLTRKDDDYYRPRPSQGLSESKIIVPSVTKESENVSVANETRTDVSLKREDVLSMALRAQEYLSQSQNQGQLIQLNQLLDKLADLLKGYTNLSKIRVNLSQDNSSIAVSWRVGTATFGANITSDTSDSSWFLIQGGIRGYKADGYLDDPSFDIQLPSLFDLLMKFRDK
jgi:hypothetical protein